jgi:hypothetical protein
MQAQMQSQAPDPWMACSGPMASPRDREGADGVASTP